MSAAARVALCLLLVAFGTLPDIGRTEETESPLVLQGTIRLAGVSGRIDHLAFDPGRKRLLVAELGNNTVDVIELAAGKVTHRIDGLREPQGIGYAPKADLIAIANAGDGSVRLFRAEDFAPLGGADLGEDADNIRLDALSDQFVVGYGNGGLAVLDPFSRSVVRRVKLPAHPEGFQIDPNAHRVFVNLPDAQQIGVVDLAAGKLVTSWRLPALRANFPMAANPARAVLAIVFRTPARLVLLDSHSGAVQANIKTCGDADDVFFDEVRKRIYVSCGQGYLDVFQQEAGGYRPLSRVKTAAGARTSLFVPELDRLFVAARAGFFGVGSDAELLIFRPRP